MRSRWISTIRTRLARVPSRPGPVPSRLGRVPSGFGRLSPKLGRISGEAWLAILAMLVSFGVAVWWLSQDTRVPDWDSGLHMIDAWTVHAQWASSEWLKPFTDFNNYPPLVHIVGALGIFAGGLHTASIVLANNIVFLPLLVGGCYGVGTLAYGRRAGLLAAIFALGTPMFASEMHEFLIDPAEAALVAASVWAILASRRFERVGYSALAALLCSLGMLSKQTFPLFVAGLIVVVLLRGGWRNWRGLGAFLLVGALLASPWYLEHFSQLHALTTASTAGGTAGAGAATANQGITPYRYSGANYAWYFWDLLNHQLLVPMTLLVAIGAATALWRFARHRDPNDLTPELIGGALVSFLGMTYITLKDPRYTLPALVYLAVLGTGWIATVRPRRRRWWTALVVAIAGINFVAVSFGVGSDVFIRLPGASPTTNDTLVEARYVTFYSPDGWLRGGPVHDGDLQSLFDGLKRLGVQQIEFDGGSTNTVDFTNAGLAWFAMVAGLYAPPLDNLPAMGPHDAFVLRRAIQPGDPPPCQRLNDGSGVYVELGNPLRFPFEETTWICPGRVPPTYRRTAPLPEVLTHNITGEPRVQLLAVMRAMRRQGIDTVEFDAVSSYSSFSDTIGLQRLAAVAGLKVPATYAPQTLGPRQAFMLRHIPVVGDPPPCERFPDGSGLYIVLGNPVIPFNSYNFYCPLRSPPFYHRAGG
jgi:Dolichyl-phosphate-mannose-protein mannosyltransferase